MAAQDYEQVTYNSPAGAQVGQSATEKIGFFGATPVVQQATIATAAIPTLTTTDLPTLSTTQIAALTATLTNVNTLTAELKTLGLIASS